MPPVSLQKASRVLESYVAGGGEPEVWKLWIALPDGLDEALVARAFARAIREPHSARVVGRALNSAYLELFLAELARHPRWPETLAASCLDADSPKRRAQQLGELFRKLGQVGIGSLSASQRDERMRAFAQDRRFVEAARRIVVKPEDWVGPRTARWSLAGVLMEDGGVESVDALLPLVERSVTEGARELDTLRRLPRAAGYAERRVGAAAQAAGAEGQPSRRGPSQPSPRVASAIGLALSPAALRFSWAARLIRLEELSTERAPPCRFRRRALLRGHRAADTVQVSSPRGPNGDRAVRLRGIGSRRPGPAEAERSGTVARLARAGPLPSAGAPPMGSD